MVTQKLSSITDNYANTRGVITNSATVVADNWVGEKFYYVMGPTSGRYNIGRDVKYFNSELHEVAKKEKPSWIENSSVCDAIGLP